MMRQQHEVRYKSKSDPAFQLDYPVGLVAALAAQILGWNLKPIDEQALRDAAKCACKLIDVCHEEAAQHYVEVDGIVPLKRDVPRTLFKEAVGQIVGKNRFKNRRQDAIRDFEKYFATRAGLFYEVTDDAVPVDDPKSAAYNRMLAALAGYNEHGFKSDEIKDFKKGYEDWKKLGIVKARTTAGTKGGVEKAKKHKAKNGKTGKYKEKDDFHLTPKEQKSLDAKIAKLDGKKVKEPSD